MNDYTASTGLGAHVFHPPASPALGYANPAFDTPPSQHHTDYFSSQRSRKRQRPDSSHGLRESQESTTPWAAHAGTGTAVSETPGWLQCPTPSDAMFASSCAQGPGLVNDRYTLKGGFDTPGLASTLQDDRAATASDFQRRARDADERRRVDGTQALRGPLMRERNGVARMPEAAKGSPQAQASSGTGWTGLAFGIVGSLFNFGTSVIKGFYAGGGKGYDLRQQLQSSPPLGWIRSQRYAGGGTPVPGAWHEDGDDFMGDFEQDNPSNANSPTLPPRPANKRRQTDRDTWVMVGTPGVDASELSPRRKISSTNVPRSSLAGRPGPASRANSRRSLAPVSRRPSTNAVYTNSPSFAPQPLAQDHKRRASIAPTRSPHSRRSSLNLNGTPTGAATSLSPDVEKMAKRRAKQEKAADRTMTNMSKQLRNLISQAQAALGTKYDVEGDDGMGGERGWEEDEGFVDEDF